MRRPKSRPSSERLPDPLDELLCEGSFDVAITHGVRRLVKWSGADAGALVFVENGECALESWYPGDLEIRERHRTEFRAAALAACNPSAAEAPSDRPVTLLPLLLNGRPAGALCLVGGNSGTARALEAPQVARWTTLLASLAAALCDKARSASQRDYERRFKRLDDQVRLLERERQKFAAIVHRSDAEVFVTDPACRIRWTNTVLSSITPPWPARGSWVGLGCQAVCSRDATAAGPHECGDCPVARALATKRPVHHEFRRGNDPVPRTFYLSALPILGPDGGVEEVLATVQDLSELEVLRRSEARYRLLFERSAKAIVMARPEDGRILLSNPMASQLTGRTAEELTDLTLEHLHPPEEWARLADLYRQAFETDNLAPFECSVTANDGSRHIVIVSGTRHDLDGRQVAMLEYQDVTESRRVTEALERAEEQLRQAQKMEAIGRLAGGIAHDFNNLLTAIMGHSELMLARVGPDDPLRRHAENVHKGAVRGALLTRQLLAFSRKEVVVPRVIDVPVVVSEMEEMLRRLIGEHIELVISVGESPLKVRADRGQLEQVIMNLAVNARDAMIEGGVLEIAVEEVATWSGPDERSPDAEGAQHAEVRISVRDTGCGMDDETVDHIFEPFFTTKDQGKGTGLGLSIVYGIVQQNGGRVEVASAPGQGSCLNVYLPRAREAAASGGAEGVSTPAAGGSETLLLVEDEDSVRAMFHEILAGAGYRVLEARDGAEALALADGYQGPIDLLVSDVVMPRMGGGELSRRLLERRPTVRVLFVSGHADDAIVRQGASREDAAFLQKPFTVLTLTRKVRAVLDAPPGPIGNSEPEGRAA